MSDNSKLTPSSRDLEVVFAAFQCLKTPPAIDAEKLAATGLFKNAASATSAFSQLRKRLFPKDGTVVLASPGAATSGKKATATADGDTAATGQTTASGSRKRGKAKVVVALSAKQEDSSGSGDDDKDEVTGSEGPEELVKTQVHRDNGGGRPRVIQTRSKVRLLSGYLHASGFSHHYAGMRRPARTYCAVSDINVTNLVIESAYRCRQVV
ncbi:uncharacterized protein B0I36DRAFT_344540 [Microdochium trichocladiopsis]|uniref:Uncharacterized protein n=1 Tax=Microdochium trichocladiopsis TaxID=1682393 RepID=A0A9P9BUD3_9PEZI|nr:uncharacterized protein B0I36DRAFT_344540 [Microdochium trichocladiopsis]KAH7040871.1 hypothetical protein B0I36DRAFT_344540 [Microdochium trichocladiopsis]